MRPARATSPRAARRIRRGLLSAMLVLGLLGPASVAGDPHDECQNVGDCDDEDPCTHDFCIDGNCHNAAIVCDDDDECTEDECVDGRCENDPCCVDLGIDGQNDGDVDGDDDAVEGDAPGKLIRLDPQHAGSGVPIELSGDPCTSSDDGSWMLVFPDHVSIYRDGTQVYSQQHFPCRQFPLDGSSASYAVYGEVLSDGAGDVEITLQLDCDGDGFHEASDSVTATVYDVELVDAQAFSPNLSGGIDRDPTSEIASESHREGAWADGASVLVWRFRPYAFTEELDFAIEHTHPHPDAIQGAYTTGSLHDAFPSLPAPHDGDGAVELTLAPGDQKVVFYRPTASFLFGGSLNQQNVRATIEWNGNVIFDGTFKLVRPVIFLSHGFTSNPSAMATMESIFTSSGRPTEVIQYNYSFFNTSGFDVAAQYIKPWIQGRLIEERTVNKIAATRVDWVGHSMGGVIAKWYAANMAPFTAARGTQAGLPPIVWPAAPYVRPDNFGLGDYRRLITLGSPLRGSPLGDLVVTSITYGAIMNIINDDPGLTGNGGAVYDLGQLSVANTILSQQTPVVDWYPIVGLATPQPAPVTVPAPFDYWIGLLYSGLGLTAKNSDFVVRDSSQVDWAGYPRPGITYKQFINHNHGQEPGSSPIIYHIMQALDIRFLDPAGTLYLPGHPLFNSGF